MLNYEIIYKNDMPELLVVNGCEIDRFKLLAFAANANDEKTSWKLMNLASHLFHWQDDSTFNTLYGSVALEITYFNSRNENHLHSLFNEKIKTVLGDNAKIINKRSDGINRPDSWISIGNEEIPVEMKLGKFNSKAMKQLARYMDAYKCARGIAVGSELSTPIPQGVIFISKDDLGW